MLAMDIFPPKSVMSIAGFLRCDAGEGGEKMHSDGTLPCFIY